jgi:hypothetical protein
MNNRTKYFQYRKKQRSEKALKGWATRRERMKERPLEERPAASGAPCFELTLRDLRSGESRTVTLLSSVKRKNTFDVQALDGKTKRGVSATKIAARIRERISL